MRAIYSLVLWLLLPYVIFRLLWRARKQPEYLRHIGERFGFYTGTVEHPVIWIHAVSVGETRATVTLIGELERRFPRHQLLFTHTTPTGRAIGEQLFGDRVTRVYLPYDYQFAVKRFIRRFKPSLGILMETEIWFNLIHFCHVSDTPLVMLNARMSAKSARGYSKVSRLCRGALGKIGAIGAQSDRDAERLIGLGASNVAVVGNLKFDIDPPRPQIELGHLLRGKFGSSRKILVAASTREGEEALLLDGLEKLDIPGLLLVIVPRHPQRFSEVAKLIESRNISYLRRSELVFNDNDGSHNHPISQNVRIVLGDTMGEMFAYYVAADLAYIGGSLLPYGGQNLIESCAVGTPVVIGPHTYNFSEATNRSVEAGAVVQVKDIEEFVGAVIKLFGQPEVLFAMKENCGAFVARNRGATAKSIAIVESALHL